MNLPTNLKEIVGVLYKKISNNSENRFSQIPFLHGWFCTIAYCQILKVVSKPYVRFEFPVMLGTRSLIFEVGMSPYLLLLRVKDTVKTNESGGNWRIDEYEYIRNSGS